MSWYRVPTGKGVPGIERLQGLSDFVLNFITESARKGADCSSIAMFWWHDLDSDEHYAYFPPSAEHVAKLVKNAERAAPPKPDREFSLQVAASQEKAWDQVPKEVGPNQA